MERLLWLGLMISLVIGGNAVFAAAEEAKSSEKVKKMDVQFEDENASKASMDEDMEAMFMNEDPFAEMNRFSQKMRQMMHPWLNGHKRSGMSSGMGPIGMGLGSSIRSDVEDTANEYIVTMDLPGYKKEDVDVNLKGNALYVKASQKSEEEKKDESEDRRVISRERRSGVVERTISFSQPVKDKGITAQYENGVLVVHVPKAEPEKNVQVEIQ